MIGFKVEVPPTKLLIINEDTETSVYKLLKQCFVIAKVEQLMSLALKTHSVPIQQKLATLFLTSLYNQSGLHMMHNKSQPRSSYRPHRQRPLDLFELDLTASQPLSVTPLTYSHSGGPIFIDLQHLPSKEDLYPPTTDF